MPGYNLAFDNVHAVEFSRTKRTRNPAREDHSPKLLWNHPIPVDQVENDSISSPHIVKTSAWR
jgi:hypothetical protein